MGKGSEDDGNWTVTLLWSLVALVVGAIFALVMVAAIACSGKGKKRKGSARETSAAAQRADSRCLLARLLASTHDSKASLLQLQATLDGAEFFPSGFGDDEKTKAMNALLKQGKRLKKKRRDLTRALAGSPLALLLSNAKSETPDLAGHQLEDCPDGGCVAGNALLLAKRSKKRKGWSHRRHQGGRSSRRLDGEHRVLRQESMQRVRAMNEEAESLFVAEMAAEFERHQRSDGVLLPTSLVEEAGTMADQLNNFSIEKFGFSTKDAQAALAARRTADEAAMETEVRLSVDRARKRWERKPKQDFRSQLRERITKMIEEKAVLIIYGRAIGFNTIRFMWDLLRLDLVSGSASPTSPSVASTAATAAAPSPAAPIKVRLRAPGGTITPAEVDQVAANLSTVLNQLQPKQHLVLHSLSHAASVMAHAAALAAASAAASVAAFDSASQSTSAPGATSSSPTVISAAVAAAPTKAHVVSMQNLGLSIGGRPIATLVFGKHGNRGAEYTVVDARVALPNGMTALASEILKREAAEKGVVHDFDFERDVRDVIYTGELRQLLIGGASSKRSGLVEWKRRGQLNMFAMRAKPDLFCADLIARKASERRAYTDFGSLFPTFEAMKTDADAAIAKAIETGMLTVAEVSMVFAMGEEVQIKFEYEEPSIVRVVPLDQAVARLMLHGGRDVEWQDRITLATMPRRQREELYTRIYPRRVRRDGLPEKDGILNDGILCALGSVTMSLYDDSAAIKGIANSGMSYGYMGLNIVMLRSMLRVDASDDMLAFCETHLQGIPMPVVVGPIGGAATSETKLYNKLHEVSFTNPLHPRCAFRKSGDGGLLLWPALDLGDEEDRVLTPPPSYGKADVLVFHQRADGPTICVKVRCEGLKKGDIKALQASGGVSGNRSAVSMAQPLKRTFSRGADLPTRAAPPRTQEQRVEALGALITVAEEGAVQLSATGIGKMPKETVKRLLRERLPSLVQDGMALPELRETLVDLLNGFNSVVSPILEDKVIAPDSSHHIKGVADVVTSAAWRLVPPEYMEALEKQYTTDTGRKKTGMSSFKTKRQEVIVWSKLIDLLFTLWEDIPADARERLERMQKLATSIAVLSAHAYAHSWTQRDPCFIMRFHFLAHDCWVLYLEAFRPPFKFNKELKETTVFGKYLQEFLLFAPRFLRICSLRAPACDLDERVFTLLNRVRSNCSDNTDSQLLKRFMIVLQVSAIEFVVNRTESQQTDYRQSRISQMFDFQHKDSPFQDALTFDTAVVATAGWLWMTFIDLADYLHADMVLMKKNGERLYEEIGDDWVVIDGFEVKPVRVHFSRAEASDDVRVPSLVTGDSLSAFRATLIAIAKELAENPNLPLHIPGHRFAHEALDRLVEIVDERIASERAEVLSTTRAYVESTADATGAMQSLREEKKNMREAKKKQQATQLTTSGKKKKKKKAQLEAEKQQEKELARKTEVKEAATKKRDGAKKRSAKAVRTLKRARVETSYAIAALEEAAGNPSVLCERDTSGAALTRVRRVPALPRPGGEAAEAARTSSRFLAMTNPAGDKLLNDVRGWRLVGLELWAPPVGDDAIWEMIRVLKFSPNHLNPLTSAVEPYKVKYLKSASGDRREGGVDNIEWWEEKDFTEEYRVPRRSEV